MNDDEIVRGFADHPVSLGEVKSLKSQNSGDWTPRECLIVMLREIDNGLNCDLLVISIRHREEGKQRFRFSQSSSNDLESVGLLQHVQVMMIVD